MMITLRKFAGLLTLSAAGCFAPIGAAVAGPTADCVAPLGTSLECGVGSTASDGGAVAVGSSAAAELAATAVGQYSNASGWNSVAVGQGSGSSGFSAVAIGSASSATNTYTVAIGRNSIATGESATSLGALSHASGASSIAIGEQSNASAAGAVALGADSISNGQGALALGQNAQAIADGAVAIGAGSIADQENTVSVGSAGAERRVVHVAAGALNETSTDAVNGAQLHATNEAIAGIDTRVTALEAVAGNLGMIQGSVDRLFDLRRQDRREMRQGIAAAVAMADAPMPSRPGGVSYQVKAGTFRGERAMSGSLTYRLNTTSPMAVSAGVSYGGGKNNAASVAFSGEF